MDKLKRFSSNYRAGKYLLHSIERYRQHVHDDRKAFGVLFWVTASIIVSFIVIALSADVTGMTLLSHIALALIAIVPSGHIAQQLVAYQASSPKHLLLNAFYVGKNKYSINRKSGISLVLNAKGKKLNLQDFSDLELFFASISSFTQLPLNIQNGLSIADNRSIAYESGFLPNLHYASAQYGTVKTRSTFIVGPLAELLPYTEEIWDHGHVRKMSKTDHDRIYAHEKMLHNDATYTVACAYLPHDHTQNGKKLDAATIRQHAIFVGLASLKTKRNAKLFAADAVHNIRVGSRSTLALAVSLLALVTASYLLTVFVGIAPLITIGLMLIIKLILEPLPAMSVVWDGIFKNHKLEHEPHQTRSHSVWDGIIAATLVGIAYISMFYSYGFSPADAAPTSILHARGLSIILLGITGCYVMTVLSQRHSTGIFNVKQLHNRIFGIGLTLSILICTVLVYFTSIKTFGLQGLPYQDLAFVLIIIGSFALISELRRHTENTNNRDHVVQLLSK